MLLRCACIVAASLTLAAPLALAQSAAPTALAPASTAAAAATDPCSSTPPAAFDVATVKPSDRPSGSSFIRTHSDSLTAGGTVFSMIEFAYELHDFQVTGGPGWLNTATWEIAAKLDKPPADWSSFSADGQGVIERERMVAVLAQRFALKCHFETRALPVYNLVFSKGGTKLKPTPADAAKKYSMDVNGRDREVRMEAYGVPMNTLVNNLSQRLGRIVIDKTGLTGLFDFTLTYARDADAGSSASTDDAAASGPTIFTALEEQLGLKLESAKGPVPILVIDSIEKPSEN